jgi:hypothetical protein
MTTAGRLHRPPRNPAPTEARVLLADESVADLAQLYLGNILYAMELAAISLDEQGKPLDASFYRGIARKLAEAHGRAKKAQPPDSPSSERPESSS